MKKKLLTAPLAAVATVGLAIVPMSACSKSIKVEEMNFTQEYSYVEVGATRDFNEQVKILPENATNKEVTWSIQQPTNNEIATVDENTGIVTGVSTGYATLTCTLKSDNTKTASQTIVVGEYVALEDFEINYPHKVISMGESITMNTKFSPQNATTAKYADKGYVKWESSNPEVAYIEGNGEVTAKAVGSVIISATPYDYNSATKSIELKTALKRQFELTVDYAEATSIDLTPKSTSIETGQTIYVSAKAMPFGAKQDVKFISASQEGIVNTSFDSTTQICTVTGVAKGTVNLLFNSISCPKATGVCTVSVIDKVTPVDSIEFVSPTKQIDYGGDWTVTSDDVEILPAAATLKDFKIVSSNPDVAYVDPTNSKKLIAKTVGTTNLTLVSEDGIHKSKTPCVVTVVGVPVTGVELNATTAEVQVDGTIKLVAKVLPENATIKDVTWSSSATNIATVDDNGNVAGVAVGGPAYITVKTKDGNKTATCTVNVINSTTLIQTIAIAPSVDIKLSEEPATLSPTISPAEATYKHLSWVSTNTSVATVQPTPDGSAIITPRAVGTTKIFANSQDGSFKSSNMCVVTVKYDDIESLTVPATKSIIVDHKGQLKATITPATACQDVTWSSSAPHVVDVDKNGELTAYTEGTAEITCTSAIDPTKFAKCTITAARQIIPVESIELNPKDIYCEVGKTYKLPSYQLTPEYCTQREVFWSVDNDNVDISKNNIVVNKMTTDTTILTCSAINGVKATCTLHIQKQQPESIEVVWPKVIDLGHTVEVTARILPEQASQEVKFKTLAPETLSVEQSGNTAKIKGLKKGSGFVEITSVSRPEVRKLIDIAVTGYTSFVSDTWENVIKYAYDGIDSLHNHYYLDCEQNIDEFKGTLIGYERTIKLYGKEHKVRVIGENHDELAGTSGKKAALTFETVNLVSDGDGNAKKYQWNSSEDTSKYTETTLFKNFTDAQTGTIFESFKSYNETLFKALKKPKKEYSTYFNRNWTKWTYGDSYFFPLTWYELNLKLSDEIKEGSTYKFYSNNDVKVLKKRRMKTDVSGNAVNYWTVSPRTHYGCDGVVWALLNKDDDYQYQATPAINDLAVSFAFCI